MDVFDSPNKEPPTSTSTFAAGEDSLIQFMNSNLPTNDIPLTPNLERIAPHNGSSTMMMSLTFSPGNDFNTYDMSKLVGAHDEVSFSRVVRQMNGLDDVSRNNSDAQKSSKPSKKQTPRFSMQVLQQASLFGDTSSDPTRSQAAATAAAVVPAAKRQKKRIVPQRVDSIGGGGGGSSRSSSTYYASANKQQKLSTDRLGITEQDLCFMDETNFTNLSVAIQEYKKTITATGSGSGSTDSVPPKHTTMGAPHHSLSKQNDDGDDNDDGNRSPVVVDKAQHHHNKPPRPTRSYNPDQSSSKTTTRQASRLGLYSPLRSNLTQPGIGIGMDSDHATLSLLNVDDLLLDCPDVNMTNISFTAHQLNNVDNNSTTNGNQGNQGSASQSHKGPTTTTTTTTTGTMNNSSDSSNNHRRGKQKGKVGGSVSNSNSNSSSSSSNTRSEGLFASVMAKVPPTKR